MTPFGFYNLNKPVGPTSHDIVAQVRRLVGPKVKVGHAGTLDPFASGVLVVCVGPATRLAEFVRDAPKRYVAEITLGATSDTDDIEGDLTVTPDATLPEAQAVEEALASLVGTIQQVPPAYSAVHDGGERAYKKARRGEEVNLAAREVVIHELTLREYAYPRLRVEVACGTGTYIRSIARDVGAALGVGGYCSELTRTAVGSFDIVDAASPDQLDIESHLVSPLTAVVDLPRFAIADADLVDLTHGKLLSVERLRHIFEGDAAADQATIVDEAGRLLALGDFHRGDCRIQPRKVFVESA